MNNRRIFQDMFFWAASTRKWGDVWWFEPGKLGNLQALQRRNIYKSSFWGSVTKFPAAEKISLRADVFVFGWCFLWHHCYIFSSPECVSFLLLICESKNWPSKILPRAAFPPGSVVAEVNISWLLKLKYFGGRSWDSKRKRACNIYKIWGIEYENVSPSVLNSMVHHSSQKFYEIQQTSTLP